MVGILPEALHKWMVREMNPQQDECLASWIINEKQLQAERN